MCADEDRAESAGLPVRPGLVVPESEIEVRSSRSSGPGGQNVNKVSTRIEVRFDVEASSVLTPEEKTRLRRVLRTRMNRDGVLRVVSQRERTQARNALAARRRLAELLCAALAVPKRRRASRPTIGSKTQRRESKVRRSRLKQSRSAWRREE